MIDHDLLHTLRGVVMEAAGTVLRNEELADQGRLTQFHHIRRRKLRSATQTLRQSRLARLRSLWPLDHWRGTPAESAGSDRDRRDDR